MRTKILVMSVLMLMMGTANAALPVTSDLVMHLEADSLGLGDGASVATWTDQSGLSNDATQATASTQPTYVASNAAYNGHATVSFDGTDDYMQLDGTIVTVDNFTLFIVGNFDTTGVEQYFISGQGGGGNDRLRVAGYGWGDGYMSRIGNTGDGNLGGPQDTAAHVIAVNGTAAGWLDQNSKVVIGTNTAGALNPSDFVLGCYDDQVNGYQKAFLTGDIAEVVLYNAILSDNDVDSVKEYLRLKYTPVLIASNPSPTGTLVNVGETLSWDAPEYSGATYNVYFGTTEPNFLVPAPYELTQIGTAGQSATTATPVPSPMAFETTYYWVVDSLEPNTVGTILHQGDPWSFTTTPEDPVVTQDPTPAYIAVDAGEPNIVLTSDGLNGDPQWYKDGSPLSDGADYGGTATKQLEIFDVQLADEGNYTVVYSSLVGSATSEPARVLTKRLMSHYPFETTSVVDGNDVTPDIVSGFDAVLKYEDPAVASLPTLNEPNAIVGTYCMQFDNADDATDPNGQFLQIPAGVVDYEDITITAWVHPKAIAPYARVFDFGTGTSYYMFLTPDTGVAYDARFGINFNWNPYQNVYADLESWNWVSPNVWHHMAVTIGGDTGRIFVDGYYRGKETVTLDPLDLSATLNYIAKSQWPQDAEFAGYMDDLKIYNYARTNEQIAQDYMEYSGTDRVCDNENNDTWRYDQGWEGDSGWIGGNNNCKIDLPDFAGFAARWLEDDNFYPVP